MVAAGNEGRNNSFGNNGYGTIGAPGNDPFVITVGAMKDAGTVTTADDTIASYSSKGPTTYRPHRQARSCRPRVTRLSPFLPIIRAHLITQFPANGVSQSYYMDKPGNQDFKRLSHAERNQHGRPHGNWRCRPVDSERTPPSHRTRSKRGS